MKKLILLFFLFFATFQLFAQEISIADARTTALGETVTVRGIVTNGSEFGGSLRYIQDETAGIAIFNGDVGAATTVGDSLLITGQLVEFNNLLEIAEDGGVVEFTVLNSGNPLPDPLTLSPADAFSEAYEGQLVRVEAQFFIDMGIFSGSTNYDISDGMNDNVIRVNNGTDIPGTPIPTDTAAIIGIMGQFADTYQLLPRSKADLEHTLEEPPMAEFVTIAEARAMDLGTTVQVKGIVTNGGELGNTRFMQDGTGGIGIFSFDLAGAVTAGDSLLITGQLSEFSNLLQITDGGGTFEYEVLNSGNTLPDPVTLDIATAYSENYEGQLVRISEASFTAMGVFAGNTNYDISDGVTTGALRVNSNTNIVGTNIPTDTAAITGILSQFQDNYQLLPRSTADFEHGIVTPPLPTTISIADARTMPLGTTVTVKGVVLNGSELGGSRYLQDETAGIGMFNGDLAAAATRGDSLLITGQLSEFNNLLQITDDGGDFEFIVINSGNALPIPADLSIPVGYTENYEGQLVRIPDVYFSEMGGLLAGGTNYDITDGTDVGQIRINNGTDIPGSEVPEETAGITGIMSQFMDTYQLLPRDKNDFEHELDTPPLPDAIPIIDARGMAVGATVTVKGIVTNGDEFGAIRYMQDETAGIAVFSFDFGDAVTRGDSVYVTGQLDLFNNLLQITDGGGFSFEIINSGNDLPEPVDLTVADYGSLYESQLVRINEVFFTEPGVFGSGVNYTLSDGMNEGAIRINSGTNIPSTVIPTDTGSVVGIMSLFQLTHQLLPRDLDDLDFDGGVIEPPTGLITIAEARAMPINATVTIKGIVTNGAEFGEIRYIQDGTAGIGVYNPDLGAVVVRGDSIQVTGQLSDFFGLLEVTDEGLGTFTFEILNSANPVPEPISGVFPSFGYSEEYEGQLIQFDNVRFVEEGNFAEGSSNYNITDGFLSYQVRVNAGTDLAGAPIPQEIINITGIMGQFNSSYQLLPRGFEDIEFIGNPPVFLTALTQTDIETTSFTVSFETLNAGSTIVEYGLTEALELGSIDNADLVTSHSATLTGLEPGTIYYVKGRSISDTGDESQSATQPMATRSLSSGDIQIYFNASVETAVSTGTDAIFVDNAMADTIKAYIDRSKYTLDIAAYSWDTLNRFHENINAAYDRGVQVRFVCDEAELTGPERVLFNADIPITLRPDALNGIMHNKVMIIDAFSDDPNDPIVFSGAMNFSDGQLHDDPNDALFIQDQSLAKGYTLEFDEMMSGKFGENKADNTPHEYIIGGKRVESYFSPSEDVRARLFDAIDEADSELYFALLLITRNNLAYALRDRADAGVFVAGIMNDDTNPFNPPADPFPWGILEDGLGDNLVEDENPYIFHHKYMIVDPHDLDSDPFVWTGSYNWSNGAQFRNDENTLIIHDEKIANIYYQEFVARFKDAGGTTLIYTGIDETEANWDVKMFPNPAQDVVYLQFAASQQTDVAIRVTDIMGKTVYTNELENAQLENITIDTSNLPNGIYILNINNEAERFVISK